LFIGINFLEATREEVAKEVICPNKEEPTELPEFSGRGLICRPTRKPRASL